MEFFIELQCYGLTYSSINTIKYLAVSSGLKLTADFSYCIVVRKSDLSNHAISLTKAIDRSFHLQARMQYEKGSQVTEPSVPEWSGHLDNHNNIWIRIIDKRKNESGEYFTIKSEFGIPNQMHTLPFINKTVGDTWEINCKL